MENSRPSVVLLLDDSASCESDDYSNSSDRGMMTPKERRQAALRELKRERGGGGSQRKRERRRVLVSSDDGLSGEDGISDDDDWEKKVKGVSGERRLGGASRLVQYQNMYNYGDYKDEDEEDLRDFIASDSEECYDDSDSVSDVSKEDVDAVDMTPNKKKKRKKTKKVVVLESSDEESMGRRATDEEETSNTASSSSSLEEEDLDLSLKNAAMVACTTGHHGRLKKKKNEYTGAVFVGRNDARSDVMNQKQYGVLSPAERIREAQKRVLLEEDNDDDGSGSKDLVSQLTDEGDPGTTESSGSPSSNDTYELSQNDEEQGVVRDDSVWREEVSKIGIHRMTEEDAFKAYIEYLFICSLDPSCESQVKHSASHRMLYTQSIQKIEYLIIQAQNCVRSEAWRSCEPYLLESMEQHALFHEVPQETRNGSQESSGPYDELEYEQCAACGKHNGSRRVQFLGKHLNNRILAGEKDVDVLLSQKYALASPIYQRNRQHVSHVNADQDQIKDADVRQFWLGSVCAKRIAIFHSLIHFRYHCMVYLKRRAKAEKVKLESSGGHRVSLNELVDSVLNDSAHARLFSCFQSLINVANTYQLKGGKEEHVLGIRPQVASAPQDILLGDAGTDVSDIDMEATSEGASGSEPSEE